MNIKKIFSCIYFYIADKTAGMKDALRPLVSDDNKNLSLGRLTFIVAFGMAAYLWISKNIPLHFLASSTGHMVDVPSGLLKVIMFLLAYNVVKLPVSAGSKYIDFKVASLLGANNNETDNADSDTDSTDSGSGDQKNPNDC